MEISISLPLDSDGFLRRRCPTCEREFKWLCASEGEEATPPPEGGYFCPYCAAQAPPDSWPTTAQLEAAEAKIFGEVVKPGLDKLEKQATSASGGFLRVTVGRGGEAVPPSPLAEADDMRQVDFPCHSDDPVKVLDDWPHAVHCLICGESVQASGEAAAR